jgi:hypothetical protein
MLRLTFTWRRRETVSRRHMSHSLEINAAFEAARHIVAALALFTN